MKKIVNFITVILLTLVMCNVFFIGKSSAVSAEEHHRMCTTGLDFTNPDVTEQQCYTTFKNTEEEYGKLSISKAGKIVISYKYGFSELLVFADPINLDKDGKEVKNYDDAVIVHLSGDKVGYKDIHDGVWGSKIVHLFGNGLTYDQKIRIELVYQFATLDDYLGSATKVSDANTAAATNTGFFHPLFCNVDDGIANCEKAGTVAGNKIDNIKRNISVRAKAYLMARVFGTYSDPGTEAEVSVVGLHFEDKKALVYKGAQSLTESVAVEVNWILGKTDVYQYSDAPISEMILVIDNTSADGADQYIQKLINDTIVPVLLGILGLAAVVSCTVLGYQIVKAADEPQERAEKIGRLKGILIGIAIAFIMTLVIGPVVDFVKKFLG